MKLRSYLLYVAILALFGWAMIEFYHAIVGIKSTVNEFVFSLNITPLILFLIVTIPAAIIFTRRQRKEQKGWMEALLFPSEFRENDEREKLLTSNATRNAYISTMIAFPILAACMLLHPFVSDYFAAYPVFILMLLPFTQITVFYLSIKKHNIT